MNQNLADLARERAAALDPARRTSTFGGGLLYSAALVGIFVISFWTIFFRGFWQGFAIGFGLYLLVIARGYLVNAGRMWWARIVLRYPMHWVERPAAAQVACAWIGGALVALSFHRRGIKLPSGLHVVVHPLAAFGVAIDVVFYAILFAMFLLGWSLVNRKRRLAGLQVHIAQTRPQSRQQRRYEERVDAKAAEWSLKIGVATGYCRGRNDERGMFAGEIGSMSLMDARGCLISGGMGSGKTTLLRNIARQTAAMPGTALVALSAKSDDTNTIASYFDDPIVIGPRRQPFALFGGLTPEAIGAAFASLAGDSKNPFWGAAVSNLVAAWLQVAFGLSGSTVVVPEKRDGPVYSPERVLTISYSPQTLSDLIYAPDDVAQMVLAEAARRLPTLSGEPHAQLSAGLAYFAGEYQATLLTARGETLGSVRASVSPYLRALCAFADAFGSGNINLSDALDAGRAVIVDIDMAQSPMGFAVVSSLILAHLRSIALARTSRDPARNNPIVVLADEFGTYASNDHLALFETARQARIAVFASIIGLSNLEARLGRAAAYGIPSALGSMITFATGDASTRKFVSERIGSVRSLEISESSNTGRHPSAPFVGSTSYGTAEHYVTSPIIEDSAWNQLGVRTGYASAIAILAQGGGVAHDVILVPA